MKQLHYIPLAYRTPDKIGDYVASVTGRKVDDLIMELDEDDEYRVDVLHPVPGDDTGLLDVVASISLFTNTIRVF